MLLFDQPQALLCLSVLFFDALALLLRAQAFFFFRAQALLFKAHCFCLDLFKFHISSVTP